MSYLGLVPSEHSSGQKTKRGSITKAGNGHVRRVLSKPPGPIGYRPGSAGYCSNDKKACRNPFASIAWKAQLRLCSRYRHLWAKGKIQTGRRNGHRQRTVWLHVGHRQ
jgi:transposase